MRTRQPGTPQHTTTQRTVERRHHGKGASRAERNRQRAWEQWEGNRGCAVAVAVEVAVAATVTAGATVAQALTLRSETPVASSSLGADATHLCHLAPVTRMSHCSSTAHHSTTQHTTAQGGSQRAPRAHLKLGTPQTGLTSNPAHTCRDTALPLCAPQVLTSRLLVSSCRKSKTRRAAPGSASNAQQTEWHRRLPRVPPRSPPPLRRVITLTSSIPARPGSSTSAALTLTLPD